MEGHDGAYGDGGLVAVVATGARGQGGTGVNGGDCGRPGGVRLLLAVREKSPKIRIFPSCYVALYGYNGYPDAEMLRLIFVLRPAGRLT